MVVSRAVLRENEGLGLLLEQDTHLSVLVFEHLSIAQVDPIGHVTVNLVSVLVRQAQLLIKLSQSLILPQDVFLGVEGQSLSALIVDQLIVLLQIESLLFEHALVNLEDFIGLSAELELLELESGLDKHEDGDLGL